MKSASFQDTYGPTLYTPATSKFGLMRLSLSPILLSTLIIATLLIAVSSAYAETRTLKMYFTHTRESATITFKKDGKYLSGGLKKANRFLRDWRRKEPTKMDPALLDLVWEVYQKSGSRKPIKVISGYRSPRTNNMLRRRGRKVAKKSQHTRGKALDFFLQDVSVTKLRSLGLKAHRGGVGYYAGSFVHLDTGSVRHWPRMSRSQLARVFPKGRTIHVPTGGKPLKGFKVAKANLKRGLNADGSRRKTSVRKTLLASLFDNKGASADEDEANASARRRAAKRPKLTKPVRAASLQRKPKKPTGPDPFSIENKVAGQNQKDEQEKQRELAAADPSKLALNRVAVPRKRPNRVSDEPVIVADATVPPPAIDAAPVVASAAVILSAAPASPAALAESAAAVSETQLRPAAPAELVISDQPTELALAAPSALPNTLRPSVDIPTADLLRVSTPETKPEVTRLKARIETALARGRIPSPAETAAEQQSNSRLAAAMKYIPVPAARENPQQTTRLALAAIPQAAPRKSAPIRDEIVEASIPAAKPEQQIRPVLDESRFASTGTAETAIPSWRGTLDQDLITASANRHRVPLPTANPGGENTASLFAGRSDDNQDDQKFDLSLGDLDGRSVKEWAVSLSTRIGPAAALTAPNYKQSTQQAAPNKVYSAGFAQARFVLRSDRFSGRALTRVAFASFGSTR